MTRAIFLEDCYAKELEATVVSAQGSSVELDGSIFCYAGGGQPSDQGKIARGGEEFSVLDVRKESGRIINRLDREGLGAGDKVRLILDWERRLKLMRGHTAMHVLSAVVNKRTGALITGGQIGLDKSRIDFSLEDFDREKVAGYVGEANDAIGRNQEIKTYFMKREEALKLPGMVKLANAAPPDAEDLRIVEIGDVDRQADGGTHVKNTSEIGKIEVAEIKNKGKNNRRVYFRLA